MSASLTLVQEVMRSSEKSSEVLKGAIEERERELMLFRDMKGLIHLQIWGALRSLVIASVSIFSILIALGGLAELSRTLMQVQTFKIDLPRTILGQQTLFNASSYFSPSTFIRYLSRLPLNGLGDATTVTLVVVVCLFVYRIWQGTRVWKQSRRYQQTIQQIEEELKTLRSWETSSG